MTEEWVSFWYQCLAQNLDYSLYCHAREHADLEACKTFETKFDRIAEIYEDFGVMDGCPEQGLNSTSWRNWFEPRKHLFTAPVQVVPSAMVTAPSPGHLRIDVQLQKDAASTLELVSRLLTDYYAQHDIPPPAPPKYALHLKNGRLAHGYEQVRQACLMSARSYVYDPITFETRTIKKAMVEFLRNEIENLGWNLDPKSLRELKDTGNIDEDRFDIFKVRFNRCRRDMAAFAQNTIRGRFPDNTPFDSQVVDQFEGEQD